MNPWLLAALVIITATASALITLGWLRLWQHLNIEKNWPFWPCMAAAAALPLGALYVLLAMHLPGQ